MWRKVSSLGAGRMRDQAIEERRRRHRTSRPRHADLFEDRRWSDSARRTEIGIGNHARDARGKVGEHEHRERREIHFPWREREAFHQRVVLRDQKAVRAHGRLRLARGSTGERDDGWRLCRERHGRFSDVRDAPPDGANTRPFERHDRSPQRWLRRRRRRRRRRGATRFASVAPATSSKLSLSGQLSLRNAEIADFRQRQR